MLPDALQSIIQKFEDTSKLSFARSLNCKIDPKAACPAPLRGSQRLKRLPGLMFVAGHSAGFNKYDRL